VYVRSAVMDFVFRGMNFTLVGASQKDRIVSVIRHTATF
jgi:hypothetical protein